MTYVTRQEEELYIMYKYEMIAEEHCRCVVAGKR